jgi:tetratricopeptide (TPR) repeat protein
MENLIKKPVSLFLIFMLGYSSLNAQNGKPVLDAFASGYVAEAAGNYSKAIESLKAVYDENSYEINLRLGWLSYLNGVYPESMNYYQKALELKPMALEAKFGYVLPASALGNWESVKRQYQEILKIDPQNTLANYRMGYIYYNSLNYSEAVKYFEKVVNLYPFDYDGLLMYAWTNYQLGKLREAKVLFNKVLMNTPGDASALEGLQLIK